MLLEELVAPQDTPVFVGVLSSANGQFDVAVYLVDFGEHSPSLCRMMGRYKKINLDIQPTQNGFMYYVTSDKLWVDLSSAVLDRALAAPPEGMLTELMRNGNPEFSSCIEVMNEEHERFGAAQAAFRGCWVLVTLAEDATEMLILADGTVQGIRTRPRADFPLQGKD